MKTIDIKGEQYVEVNERLKHFRTNYKDWALESELISNDNGVCVIKAIIKNPDGVIKATGYAYEKENSTFINKTSYIENCETSAWGRALGNLGIGIDTSIASAEEVLNANLNQPKKQEKKQELAQSLEEYQTDMNLISTIEDLKAYGSGIKEQINTNKELNKMFWKRMEELEDDAKREAKAS